MITSGFEDLIYQDYSIVYADPPWKYEDRGVRGGTEAQYRAMSVYDLCDLEVKRICADDAILFMWTTWPILMQGSPREVMLAWGFEPRTIGFVWVKQNDDGTLYSGTGHYTRANTEPCLIGVAGQGLDRVDRGVSSVIMSSRRQHSAKPDEARWRIEKLYGEQKRVELFARRGDIHGWDAWGNEVVLGTDLL